MLLELWAGFVRLLPALVAAVVCFAAVWWAARYPAVPEGVEPTTPELPNRCEVCGAPCICAPLCAECEGFGDGMAYPFQPEPF
jgi:hypothetical protein